jgi:hypothetical protein
VSLLSLRGDGTAAYANEKSAQSVLAGKGYRQRESGLDQGSTAFRLGEVGGDRNSVKFGTNSIVSTA